MRRNGGTILLALGAIGTVAGAVFVYNNVYDFYRPKQLPPSVGIFGAGVVLLAIGLAKLKGALPAVLVVVIGAAAAVGAIVRGKARADDRMAGYERDAEVMKAAEAVCSGTPNVAAASPGPRPRPIMLVTQRPEESDKTLYPGRWEGLPAPATVADLQLVACRVSKLEAVTGCSYTNESGASYYISKNRRIDTIKIVEAKTGQVHGEQTFRGGEPSDRCDESIKVRETGGMRQVTGEAPSAADELAFARTFVEAR